LISLNEGQRYNFLIRKSFLIRTGFIADKLSNIKDGTDIFTKYNNLKIKRYNIYKLKIFLKTDNLSYI
jgi:hypothetical protein